MKNKIGISARGTGKVNEKGEIEEYKLISYDFTSLYPQMINPITIKKEILRKQRKEKLEEIEKKIKDNDDTLES